MMKSLDMDDELEPDFHGMVGILPTTDTHHEETHSDPQLHAPQGKQVADDADMPIPWGDCP